ncbi:MmcB family DNA repair protein [Limoniibacter endophyticus]|uniref:DNA repair protein MmcB-related protein n=1 Tax=Limoniibacter endophyticus TaxID=1565040 RepID=A0A8J3DG77_9HYPH|nr:MmcB family DNA repair protein [Limoniibacter endophyticus]GHC66816.1 hypothetical protein GCM10010136_10240 [Limoniibacter endophyticus]
MPIVSALDAHPLRDGRQSPRALSIRRGVQLMLAERRIQCLPELCLRSGRRADLTALTEKGEIWIIEVKSSVEDFRVDKKWPDYRDYCDRLFFATLADVPAEIFPDECGFILADAYGAEIMREAPQHALPAARRKAMLTRFSRSAAARLFAAELAGVPIQTIDAD